MYDHMRKIVKYTNEANRIVHQYNSDQKDESPITITDEHKNATRKFINNQKILWSKYTTTAARSYKNNKNGKHKSGILSRSDDRKDDSLQKAKLALANTWVKLQFGF